VETLHGVLQQRADFVPARLALGSLHAEHGDVAGAIGEFRAAIAAAPRNAEAWLMLAEALRLQGGCGAAVSGHESAGRLDPGHLAARQQLAACYRDLGKPEKAARLAAVPGRP